MVTGTIIVLLVLVAFFVYSEWRSDKSHKVVETDKYLPPLHGGYKPRLQSTRPKIDPPKPPKGRGGGS